MEATLPDESYSTQPHVLHPIGVQSTFLTKTMTILDTCDAAIAGWTDQGAAFVVRDAEAFAATLLPVHFKHSNFKSFVRQLNLYGFKKVRTHEKAWWQFQHELFRRGDRHHLRTIKRGKKAMTKEGAVTTNGGSDLARLKQIVESLDIDVQGLAQGVQDVVAKLQEFATIRIANRTHERQYRVDLPSPCQFQVQGSQSTSWGLPDLGDMIVMTTFLNQIDWDTV
ncbi:Aste57867_18301 [Aphanomyces stellatus]|uniref:Aste57867_18301 protein n=1 Tax=Aphanomyces stellatus TaxID=120398 RepID=A0A485LDF8_9STRA|nr:hypothetical protein As57867_018239 [Aphanomyces stellatus]VFT95037.1 Aste57867_18301 [Aphanomyces stellatus]